MDSDSSYTILWILWGIQFWAIEGPALFRRDYPATLTAHIRDWAGFKGKPRGWRIRRATLLGFLAWLIAHLVLPPGTF